MNKVIIINLNGIAYQLEESGYEALRRYLDAAARRLEGNPDKDEIIADIEQSIADKFRAVLGANKTVVVGKEVLDVIEEMGPVQDASDGAAAATEGPGPATAPGDSAAPPKRLYRIREGAQIAGVCNGLAAYFNVDVTLIRIIFACMVLTGGAGIVLYLLMVLVVPWANTSAEKAAATGAPFTAEEFIRRAKEGYYEGMKAFGDRRAFRAWKGQFKQEMRQRRRDFQRQMHQNAEQWRQNWHQQWAGRQPPHPGWWLALPVLTLLSVLLTLLCVASIASLVLTGAVFGFFMPSGIHLWLGILILIVVFSILKWPLRVMRHAYYYHGCGPGYPGPCLHPFTSLTWLAVLAIVLLVANHHSPGVHETLVGMRHEARHVVDSLRDWWNGQ
jgi:phage shock protein PspC (stress-responsive transcriptional regulator)